MNWLLRLLEAGFRPVGQWRMVEGGPVCQLVSHGSSSDVLYAFVLDGDVMYVGKTAMPLSRRMYGYQKPGPTQRTNLANNRLISKALTAGRCVDVYALVADRELMHHGFRISLAAGLEDDLVRQLKPPWNKSGS